MATKTNGTDPSKVLRVVDFDSGSNSFTRRGKLNVETRITIVTGYEVTRKVCTSIAHEVHCVSVNQEYGRVTLSLSKYDSVSPFDRLRVTQLRKQKAPLRNPQGRFQ